MKKSFVLSLVGVVIVGVVVYFVGSGSLFQGRLSEKFSLSKDRCSLIVSTNSRVSDQKVYSDCLKNYPDLAFSVSNSVSGQIFTGTGITKAMTGGK